MKKKILKLVGILSAFFLSILGLTGCAPKNQALYGVPSDIQQDLYGVPAPTQKFDPKDFEEAPKETFEDSMSEISDTSLDF